MIISTFAFILTVEKGIEVSKHRSIIGESTNDPIRSPCGPSFIARAAITSGTIGRSFPPSCFLAAPRHRTGLFWPHQRGRTTCLLAAALIFAGFLPHVPPLLRADWTGISLHCITFPLKIAVPSIPSCPVPISQFRWSGLTTLLVPFCRVKPPSFFSCTY